MRGHIKKRSARSYSVVVPFGVDPATGQRRQKWVTVKGTKKDAERRLAELVTELESGTYVDPSKMMVGEFLRQWLKVHHGSSNVRDVTAQGYSSIIENHLVPALGRVELARLNPQHIQLAYAKALKGGRKDGRLGGLSPTTVLQHHRVLKEALTHAVKWEMIARNPADGVEPPRRARPEVNFYRPEEAQAFIEAARDSYYYTALHTALHTGLRRSELLGLQWRDIDFESSMLSVVRVLHKIEDGTTVIEPPKTVKGRRTLVLTAESVDVLRRHLEGQMDTIRRVGGEWTGETFVFDKGNGEVVHPDALASSPRGVYRDAGLRPISLKGLRHTHATILFAQGVHPKVVSERLGHASIGITLDIYSHVIQGMQEEAVSKFEEAMRGSG